MAKLVSPSKSDDSCPDCKSFDIEKFHLRELNIHHCMCICGTEWVE